MAEDDSATATAAERVDDRGRRPRTPSRAVPRVSAGVVLLSVIALILVGAALRATQWITMPLAFAFFTALVFWPVHEAIKGVLPRWLDWLAHLAVGLMIVVVVGLFLGSLWFAAERIGDRAPAIGEDIQSLWQSRPVQQLMHMPGSLAPDGGSASTGGNAAAATGGTRQEGAEPAANGDAEATGGGMLSRERVVGAVSSGALTVVNSLTHAIAVFTLVLFFTILMLAEVPVWARKAASATDGEGHRTWYQATVVVSQRVRWYLVTRGVLGAVTGLLYVGWLWLFDVDLLIVWFLLTLLLSFIPTLGSLISGLLPIVYALVTKDLARPCSSAWASWWSSRSWATSSTRRCSAALSLSPLVLLFSLVFWVTSGHRRRPARAPMMVLLTVVLAQCQATVPFALLLSDETDYEGLSSRSSRTDAVPSAAASDAATPLARRRTDTRRGGRERRTRHARRMAAPLAVFARHSGLLSVGVGAGVEDCFRPVGRPDDGRRNCGTAGYDPGAALRRRRLVQPTATVGHPTINPTKATLLVILPASPLPEPKSCRPRV